jgi:DNA polymerase III delta prime subunit
MKRIANTFEACQTAPAVREPMLIVLSGLPGVGKTTIARELARSLSAVHVRVDSIEQELRRAGLVVEGEGYAVAHAVATDNLRVGRTVVVDCVNPWPLTRGAPSLNRAASASWKSSSYARTRMSIDAEWNRACPISQATRCQPGRRSWNGTTARGTVRGSSSTPVD